MASSDELVSAVRKHAEANYNLDGWDFVVECWGDSDIRDTLHAANAKTEEEAIAAVLEIVQIQDERRRDIEAEIF